MNDVPADPQAQAASTRPSGASRRQAGFRARRLSLLSGPRTVVLCSSNICRLQHSEVLFRSLLTGIVVSSIVVVGALPVLCFLFCSTCFSSAAVAARCCPAALHVRYIAYKHNANPSDLNSTLTVSGNLGFRLWPIELSLSLARQARALTGGFKSRINARLRVYGSLATGCRVLCRQPASLFQTGFGG